MSYYSNFRPHFTFPKPISTPQPGYVDEKDANLNESPLPGADGGVDTEGREEGIVKGGGVIFFCLFCLFVCFLVLFYLYQARS